MKKIVALLLAGAALAPAALAQAGGTRANRRPKEAKMKKQHINPAGMSNSPAYSQAVAVTGGRTIYISGQVPLDAGGELVGRGDLRAQTRQVFENLKTVLAAAGATFEDVVKLGFFVKNYKPSDVAVIREVRGLYLPKDKPLPASTLVGVAELFRDDILIEIECIAVVD